MSAVTVLEANQLRKSYSSIVALDNATVRFEENKIYGLFGRNRAGKSTLLDILSARIFADQGDVNCYGQDILKNPEAISQHCCYMPEKHFFSFFLFSDVVNCTLIFRNVVRVSVLSAW